MKSLNWMGNGVTILSQPTARKTDIVLVLVTTEFSGFPRLLSVGYGALVSSRFYGLSQSIWSSACFVRQ